ncbi:hypothetical protein QQ045_015856 [Rhodiola kirilowii]
MVVTGGPFGGCRLLRWPLVASWGGGGGWAKGRCSATGMWAAAVRSGGVWWAGFRWDAVVLMAQAGEGRVARLVLLRRWRWLGLWVVVGMFPAVLPLGLGESSTFGTGRATWGSLFWCLAGPLSL